MEVARHLLAQEVGLLEGLILALQLNLRHHQSLVVAKELIHLNRVLPVLDEVAILAHPSGHAQGHHLTGILQRHFRLELIPRETVLPRGSLDGQIALVVANPHPHRLPRFRREIPLLNVRLAVRKCLPLALQQKFPFYFLMCHYSSVANSIRYALMKSSSLPSITPPTSLVW